VGQIKNCETKEIEDPLVFICFFFLKR